MKKCFKQKKKKKMTVTKEFYTCVGMVRSCKLVLLA